MTMIGDVRILGGRDNQRMVAVDVETTDDWQWLVVRADGSNGSLLQRIVVTNLGEDGHDADVRVAETIETPDFSPGDPDDPDFPWKIVEVEDDLSDGDDVDEEYETTSGAYAVGVKSSASGDATDVRIVIRKAR